MCTVTQCHIPACLEQQRHWDGVWERMARLSPVPVSPRAPGMVAVRFSSDLASFEMQCPRSVLLKSPVLREALDMCGSGNEQPGEQLALSNPRVSASAVRLALAAFGCAANGYPYCEVFWNTIGGDAHAEARVVDYLHALHWLELLDAHRELATRNARTEEYVAAARFVEDLATDLDDPDSSAGLAFGTAFFQAAWTNNDLVKHLTQMAAVFERGVIGRRLVFVPSQTRACSVEDAKAFMSVCGASYDTKARLLLLLTGFPVLATAALVFEHVGANPHGGAQNARAAIEMCSRRLEAVYISQGMATAAQNEIAICAMLNSPMLIPAGGGGGALPKLTSQANLMGVLDKSAIYYSYPNGSGFYSGTTARFSCHLNNLIVCRERSEAGDHKIGVFEPPGLTNKLRQPGVVFLAVVYQMLAREGGQKFIVPRAVPGLVAVKPELGSVEFARCTTANGASLNSSAFVFVFEV
jgi:hypothetical protein